MQEYKANLNQWDSMIQGVKGEILQYEGADPLVAEKYYKLVGQLARTKSAIGNQNNGASLAGLVQDTLAAIDDGNDLNIFREPFETYIMDALDSLDGKDVMEGSTDFTSRMERNTLKATATTKDLVTKYAAKYAS
jgi:hypothetical protein